MIKIKNAGEIETMAEGGKRLALVMKEVLGNVAPGVTTGRLNRIAEAKMIALEGEPSFKKVPHYHWAICTSVNNEVVHGIPGKRIIQKDDVIGLDAGLYYQGFHTDMSYTMQVKSQKVKGKSEVDTFLGAGQKALDKAIALAKPGNYVGHLSQAIQETIEEAGYSVVRALTGHGIGVNLHEDPPIPCFLDASLSKTPRLVEGMVLAIEVIYNQGMQDVVLSSDGWTILTKDGKISALFEETVAVRADGPLILTRLS